MCLFVCVWRWGEVNSREEDTFAVCYYKRLNTEEISGLIFKKSINKIQNTKRSILTTRI